MEKSKGKKVFGEIRTILKKEKPDGIMLAFGGQTALNCGVEIAKKGVFEKYGVEMLGANQEVIEKAEDRAKFKALIDELGLRTPKSSEQNRPSLDTG